MQEMTEKPLFILIILALFTAGTALALDMAAPGQPLNQKITLMGGTKNASLALNISLNATRPDWLLPATTAVMNGTMNITAESNWLVTVSSDRSNGRMAERDAIGYIQNGRVLHNSLSIKAGNNAAVSLSSDQRALISGLNPVLNESIPLKFIQPVTWSDGAVQTGRVYSLDVSFIISLSP